MGVESKLVTLADLKAAYDDLKRRTTMWEDITDQLTFSAATWLPMKTGSSHRYDWEKTTSNLRGSTASIPVNPGERYRVTGWSAGDNLYINEPSSRYVATILSSSNQVIGAYGPTDGSTLSQGTNEEYHAWTYGSAEVVVPPNATTLVVFSFGGTRGRGATVNDVVLEKLIQ